MPLVCKITLRPQIPFNFSRHPFQSVMSLGRSSRLHSVSVQCRSIQVFASRPKLVCACVRGNRRTLLIIFVVASPAVLIYIYVYIYRERGVVKKIIIAYNNKQF